MQLLPDVNITSNATFTTFSPYVSFQIAGSVHIAVTICSPIEYIMVLVVFMVMSMYILFVMFSVAAIVVSMVFSSDRNPSVVLFTFSLVLIMFSLTTGLAMCVGVLRVLSIRITSCVDFMMFVVTVTVDVMYMVPMTVDVMYAATVIVGMVLVVIRRFNTILWI